MHLLIDARGEDNVFVGFGDNKKISNFEIYKKGTQSILEFVLEKFKLKSFAKNLQSVFIIPGPGGFSTVRSAAVLANTLNFSLDMKLILVEPNEGETREDSFLRYLNSKNIKSQAQVLPVYSKNPNITIPKS